MQKLPNLSCGPQESLDVDVHETEAWPGDMIWACLWLNEALLMAIYDAYIDQFLVNNGGCGNGGHLNK